MSAKHQSSPRFSAAIRALEEQRAVLIRDVADIDAEIARLRELQKEEVRNEAKKPPGPIVRIVEFLGIEARWISEILDHFDPEGSDSSVRLSILGTLQQYVNSGMTPKGAQFEEYALVALREEGGTFVQVMWESAGRGATTNPLRLKIMLRSAFERERID